MLAYRNSVSRLIYQQLNKQIRQKKTVTTWNIQNRYEATHPANFKYGQNIFQEQSRFFHISRSCNKIIPFNLSDIGEGIREVIVKEWFVKEGDKVLQFDNICEVQSDKASVTITSRYDGVITKLYHAVDDIALVGKPLIDIETLEKQDATETSKEPKSKIETSVPLQEQSTKENTVVSKENNNNSRGLAIPSVRRIAKQNNIEISNIIGTGKDGRVLKEDILNYINKQMKSVDEKDCDIDIAPVRGYTRAMIKTMTEAMKIPHFVYHDEICVTNLVKLRTKLKQKSTGINITYLPFFIKATSNALLQYPILNSRLDDNQENIIHHKSHNISIAVDSPTGLAVPVIKNVQNKNIIEISKDIARLKDLGKQSKFTKEDLAGGTFTFSNIGAIGGSYAKPIILPPQSAIIALGSFQDVPRYSVDGSLKRETVSFISGAADHRIIDGATMARFCNLLKEQIENPELLLLNI